MWYLLNELYLLFPILLASLLCKSEHLLPSPVLSRHLGHCKQKVQSPGIFPTALLRYNLRGDVSAVLYKVQLRGGVNKPSLAPRSLGRLNSLSLWSKLPKLCQ